MDNASVLASLCHNGIHWKLDHILYSRYTFFTVYFFTFYNSYSNNFQRMAGMMCQQKQNAKVIFSDMKNTFFFSTPRFIVRSLVNNFKSVIQTSIFRKKIIFCRFQWIYSFQQRFKILYKCILWMNNFSAKKNMINIKILC